MRQGTARFPQRRTPHTHPRYSGINHIGRANAARVWRLLQWATVARGQLAFLPVLFRSVDARCRQMLSPDSVRSSRRRKDFQTAPLAATVCRAPWPRGPAKLAPSSPMFPAAYGFQSAPNPVTAAGNLPRFPCFPAPVPVTSLPRFPVGCHAATLGFTLAHVGHCGKGIMTALRQSGSAVTEQRRNAAKKVVDGIQAFWHDTIHGNET